ncbi:hypothetical protein KAW65_00255 [candidate division WOR-3 bacterium]|nr:hypothetical protein [candidate division WOR-3 bacterium]
MNQNYIRRGLVADKDAKHYYRVKNAIWLYLYLVLSANSKTGKLLSRLDFIASQMGICKDTLQTWLGHLKKWGYVTTQKQGESIVFKLSRWKESYQPKVEAKAKEELLAERIAKTFKDEENLSYYETLCERYSEDLINLAFREVKKIPSSKIRKSRGALFTYLVKKYAKK